MREVAMVAAGMTPFGELWNLSLRDLFVEAANEALIAAGGEKAWKEWVQAYLACAAFIDDQVGRILEVLEESPYGKNTIVIFSSDHGYHVGEKDCIQKWHLWNESTRVPLIIRVPGSDQNGMSCSHPVSLVDLYPTILDLLTDYLVQTYLKNFLTTL